jgi:protein SCO1
MKPRNNKGFILGMAVAVLLPLSFYFLLTKVFRKDRIIMPKYYLTEGVDSSIEDGKVTYKTKYHQVSDLVLTNQLGQQVSLNKDLKGKVLLIDFIFTNCPNICPQLTKNMSLLQAAFKRDRKKEFIIRDEIQLITITVNPERDSFPLMRKYADKFGADHDHWWFLTGDKKAIYNYARNELAVSVGTGDGGADDFIHTEKMVILDRNRHIRGYFDGLDSADLKKCADHLVLVVLEKEKKKQ